MLFRSIGICTPTEAGALGAVLAFFVACVQKRMNFKIFKNILIASANMIGMIYMVISCAMLMKQMLALSGLTFAMSDAVLGLALPNGVLMVIILIVYIILGMFFDATSMILLTVGLFLPIVQQCGYSALWFGVIMVRMGDIGGLTPPMGMTAFFLKGLAKRPLAEVFKGVTPLDVYKRQQTARTCCVFAALFMRIPSITTVGIPISDAAMTPCLMLSRQILPSSESRLLLKYPWCPSVYK